MIFLVADCMAHAFALNTCSFYINTILRLQSHQGQLRRCIWCLTEVLKEIRIFFISFSLYVWLLCLLGDILTVMVFPPLFKMFLSRTGCFYFYLSIYIESSNPARLVILWKWWKAARKCIVSLILLVVLKNSIDVCLCLCWKVLCLYLQKLWACCKGSASAFQVVSALGFQSGGPWSVLWLLVNVFALNLLH